MTKIEQVVSYLRDNGPTKPDDMLPHLTMTKKQLLDALGNGAIKGRCHVQSIKKLTGKGQLGGTVCIWAYGPGPKRQAVERLQTIESPRGEYAWIGPVSSVWQLGAMQ